MSVRDSLLLPAIACTIGVFAAPLLALHPREIALAAATFLLAAIFSRYRTLYLAGLSLCAGIALQHFGSPGPNPQLDAASGEIVTLTGCVIEPPALSEGREQFTLELDHNASARVSLYLTEGEPPPVIRYGQRIELTARVRMPHNFGNPGAFDYAGYLARRHIYWTASSVSGSRPKLLPGQCGSPVMAWLYGLRTRILDRIESLYAGNNYAIGILQALLIGESSRMERTWADDYRRTGTYHAIVVSGLHVTVIAAALLLVLRLFCRRDTARLLALSLIWIYAGICGWQAPVVRSAGGFTLYAIAGFFFRQSRILNLLAALAIAFLAVDPQQIEEASFILTFLSVLALGALAAPATESTSTPRLYGLKALSDTDRDMHLPPLVAQFRIELRLVAETLQLWLRLPGKAAQWAVRLAVWPLLLAFDGFLVSAAVQLGLALPMVIYFHRLSLSGLSANLIVTPLLTFAVPLGFLALLTGWGWTVTLAALLVHWARVVTEWHLRWEPNWRVPDPPLWLAAAFTASLLLLALTRRRLALIPSLALLGVILYHPFEAERTPGSLELTMIDVGQGDSLLIGFPTGEWMVVDGGGIPVFGKRAVKSRMDIGEDVVSPYLFSRGIRRVDIIASTHQHDDHAAGLAALIENFRPRELWAGATPDSALWRSLTVRAAKLGARIRNPQRGDSFSFGDTRIDTLAPSQEYAPRDAPSNNDSLVLRLTYGRHHFLLTGDIERQGERSLLDDLGNIEVLKVAHHGSRTSTTDLCLDTAKPLFALVSAGYDNLFHHPHPDVVRRLEQHGTRVLRTDVNGLITVRTDGKRFSLDTFRR